MFKLCVRVCVCAYARLSAECACEKNHNFKGFPPIATVYNINIALSLSVRDRAFMLPFLIIISFSHSLFSIAIPATV